MGREKTPNAEDVRGFRGIAPRGKTNNRASASHESGAVVQSLPRLAWFSKTALRSGKTAAVFVSRASSFAATASAVSATAPRRAAVWHGASSAAVTTGATDAASEVGERMQSNRRDTDVDGNTERKK